MLHAPRVIFLVRCRRREGGGSDVSSSCCYQAECRLRLLCILGGSPPPLKTSVHLLVSYICLLDLGGVAGARIADVFCACVCSMPRLSAREIDVSARGFGGEGAGVCSIGERQVAHAGLPPPPVRAVARRPIAISCSLLLCAESDCGKASERTHLGCFRGGEQPVATHRCSCRL